MSVAAQPRIAASDDRAEGSLAGEHLDLAVDRSRDPIATLLARLAPTTSVLLSTADGFPLWSNGLSEWQVEQVTAMGAALHAVLGSTSDALRGSDQRTPSTPPLVVIAHDDVTTVVFAVPALGTSGGILWVTGPDSTGTLVAHGRAAARSIEGAVA